MRTLILCLLAILPTPLLAQEIGKPIDFVEATIGYKEPSQIEGAERRIDKLIRAGQAKHFHGFEEAKVEKIDGNLCLLSNGYWVPKTSITLAEPHPNVGKKVEFVKKASGYVDPNIAYDRYKTAKRLKANKNLKQEVKFAEEAIVLLKANQMDVYEETTTRRIAKVKTLFEDKEQSVIYQLDDGNWLFTAVFTKLAE